MEARLRSMWTAGPPEAVSRSSMTVAARRGSAGVSSPSASARMRSGHSGGYHWPLVVDDMAGGYAAHARMFEGRLARRRAPADAGALRAHGTRPGLRRPDGRAYAGELDLDLDLDRRVQRQHRHADRAARVHALVAEDLAQQLAGAVDDAGLAGEVRGGGDEADDLHDALRSGPGRRRPTSRRPARSARRCAASSLASSGVTSAPTLPVTGSLPSTIGSWPEV